MWIICQADDPHEMWRFIFFENYLRKKKKKKKLSAAVVSGTLRVKMYEYVG